MKKNDEIRELQKENKMLKAELAKAEKKLRRLMRDDTYEMTAYVSGKAARYEESNHYLGFLIRSLEASNIYNKVKTVLKFFSKFKVITYAIRIILIVVTFIETSAHVILLSTATLITLPVTTALGIITFILAWLGSNSANKKLADLPYKKNVYVFFPESTKQFKGDTFFKGWVKEIASDKKNIVFIVSPVFWKSSGYVKGKYYLHYRQDADNIYMIRKYYFFSFRRNVLMHGMSNKTFMIH